MNNSIPNQVYGFNNALTDNSPPPIVLNVSPGSANLANIGRLWINKSLNTAFILTSIVGGEAFWQPFSGNAAFTSLTVFPGPISLTGVTEINTSGVATTTIGNASSFVDINGSVFINCIGSTNTNINTTGTGAVFIGNSTGDTEIYGGNLIINGTGNIEISGGNLIINDGNVQLVDNGTAFILPGPSQIISGSGTPANGLAINTGDIYVNLTGSTTTNRLYIATAPGGPWATFTTSS